MEQGTSKIYVFLRGIRLFPSPFSNYSVFNDLIGFINAALID